MGFVVIYGVLWWFALVCGGLRYFDGPVRKTRSQGCRNEFSTCSFYLRF